MAVIVISRDAQIVPTIVFAEANDYRIEETGNGQTLNVISGGESPAKRIASFQSWAGVAIVDDQDATKLVSAVAVVIPPVAGPTDG